MERRLFQTLGYQAHYEDALSEVEQIPFTQEITDVVLLLKFHTLALPNFDCTSDP